MLMRRAGSNPQSRLLASTKGATGANLRMRTILPMRFKSDIEFANYTLTFGDEKVLLDCLHEIVIPSFEDQRYVRRTSAASWFSWIPSSSH
jgi:hypothetical protein